MRVAVVLGTRPEIIKLAPVILEGKRRGHSVSVIFTGQHRQLGAPLLRFFNIRPDFNLSVMVPNQTLSGLSARVLDQLDQKVANSKFDALVVQGDTTSAFIGGYWAFCRGLPVAHVEAGLRTLDLNSPFPEEGNRQLLGRISKWHFAPTLRAAQALRAERVPKSRIFKVGNTGIDALHYTLEQLKNPHEIPRSERLPQNVGRFLTVAQNASVPTILVTAHRRESFGSEMNQICEALKTIADRGWAKIVYPVHPNPNVRNPVNAILSRHPNILLCEPLPYVAFVSLMKASHLLLTDSGGVQEEGPTLKKPILVIRKNTERPEGVEAGFSKLIGTQTGKIVREVKAALENKTLVRKKNPYGDGQTSVRIWKALEKG